MTAFKPFEEMTDSDYTAVGLRVGLEVHQQLLTDKKLFCRCPAGRYGEEYDAEILRHMRPTLSELGEYDGTALMEFKTRKQIVYRINGKTICTYEMDDTPPFMMDEQALDIALEVAMLLNLNRVDELHIARKQYLDGSIPTGFQRTTILGVDGWIPYKKRRIGIVQLGLEEDSCREISDAGHTRIYLTDRLGMPLIEPVTAPDMHSPHEVAEVGEILRRLMRSTGKVRTGVGATRQDVNVSIDGGTRIEIKGVPSLKRVPRLVYNEAFRQWNLLRLRKLLAVRGVNPETIGVDTTDVTRALAPTRYEPLRRALGEGAHVRCVRLCGFGGMLRERTQTDTTFAREFSDRVRVIACLTALPNIVHSDAASETLAAAEWRELRRRCRAEDGDALVVVWGGVEDVATAEREIEIRARDATEGVPKETRQALRDGTTGFERILPGADRMYPDTDLPPMRVGAERIARVRSGLPEPVWEREERYRGMGLSDDVVAHLVASPRAMMFDRLVAIDEAGVAFFGDILGRHARSLRRRGFDPLAVSDAELESLVDRWRRGEVSRDGVLGTVEWLVGAPLRSLGYRVPLSESTIGCSQAPAPEDDARVEIGAKELGLRAIDDDAIDREIDRAFEHLDGRQLRRPARARDVVMGRVMKVCRGCAEGARIARRVEARLAAGRAGVFENSPRARGGAPGTGTGGAGQGAQK